MEEFPEALDVVKPLCSLSCTHVEQQAFRNFFQYIYPTANDVLPHRRLRSGAIYKEGTTANNWKWPNHLGVMGFTVQFVTEDHSLPSGGEDQGASTLKLLREFGIASKVGYSRMDNACNISTISRRR